MNTDMAISDDSRRLVRNLAQRQDVGLHVVMQPLLDRIDKNLFDRLMIHQDRPKRKQRKRIWPFEIVEILGDITAAFTPYKACDVVTHLMDPSGPVDPGLRALVRHEEHHLHAGTKKKRMEAKYRAIARGARKVISCEGPLRLDLNSEQVVKAQVKNESLVWGLSDQRVRHRKSLALGRRDIVLRAYETAESVIVGQRSAFYDDLDRCCGLYCGLDPAHAVEAKSDFADEVVKDLGVDYRCINEAKWPADLRSWAENYDRIIAFDDRAIIYVKSAGSDIFILEKSGDPVRDALFNQELGKLYLAVGPKFLRHVPTQEAVLEMLGMDADAIEQRRREIDDERPIAPRADTDRTIYPIWLPSPENR